MIEPKNGDKKKKIKSISSNTNSKRKIRRKFVNPNKKGKR